ncbi:MAG: hypothetical protein ACK5W3_05340, partial [Hyphomonadaceae bacterium]
HALLVKMSVLSVSYPWLYPSQVLEPPANPVRFRLEVQALRLKRLDAVESQFNQDKILDATEMAFRNASKDRYLPVAFLIFFHCSLIWRRLV